MTLDPLLAAPLVVRLHAATAMAAIPLGAAQFLLPKGDPRHRALGWAWVVLMGVTAASALGITGRAGAGRWSWIHGLVALVAVLLPLAVLAARRGHVRRHRATMLGLYLGALLITGALTLTPGRVMHRVVFGG
ncbi:DUF2306 domain-containing protein [Roseomonas sp. CECT 9278]|uniref:DUF2306 domain-containing protein n=1 Tax=Roseomonas sp. CECT 9278 TaxID=2845823 RepID=UPI001E6519E9|nr:DUF2306 domain-containing protein [Roseomonas sp. CECT 9278]CAH0199107.1 hypothetical protein ROS9278_01876 [Roseomonas sp. CECT 9278]